MTLIATHLDRNGIVFASDSSLTVNGHAGGTTRKIFEVPHLHAALNVAGSFSVEGKPLQEWMPKIIDEHKSHERQSLKDFAEYLRAALTCGMDHIEKDTPTLVHIAGYASDGNGFHPEFHFVRNAFTITPNGDYSDVSGTFQTTEDFWERDCRHKDSQTGFLGDEGNYPSQTYVNGFESGRAGYLAVQEHTRSFFSDHVEQSRLEISPAEVARRVQSAGSNPDVNDPRPIRDQRLSSARYRWRHSTHRRSPAITNLDPRRLRGLGLCCPALVLLCSARNDSASRPAEPGGSQGARMGLYVTMS